MTLNIAWLDIVLMTLVISMSTLTKCSNSLATNSSLRCEDARMRCAYRTGCGMALQQYLTRCTSVLHGDINKCPESCQHALIALTSTDEGKELMRCDCTEEDHLCLQSKQKVEVCRSSVIAAMNRTRVSCRIATWICNADAICYTALAYYNGYCKSMFHGKKCTHRCRNSINILRRQEKADKLNTCFCDGAEDYDCKSIHRNMNSLCYKKSHHIYQDEKKSNEDTSTNVNNKSSNAVSIKDAFVINRITLLTSMILLFFKNIRLTC